MSKPIVSKSINMQILRAAAAIAVVLYHVGVEKSHICADVGSSCVADLRFGIDGVRLFFMISGFIMVVSSWNAFGKPGASWNFIKRRIQRIVPLYWIMTTVGVIGIALAPSMLTVPVLDPLYVAGSYLFYPVTRVNGLVRPIANLGWTLELQVMFYMVFMAALQFNRKLGLILTMAFLALFSAGGVLGLYGQSVPLNFWSDPIILDFIVGMVVAILYKGGIVLPRSAVWGLGIASVILAAGVVLQTEWIHSFPEANLLPRLIVGLPAACVFVLSTLGPQLSASGLIARISLVLSNASFSLYLAHPFMLRVSAKIWAKFFESHMPMWAFTCASTLVAIASGLVLYWLVERPLANFLVQKQPLKPAPRLARATNAVP